MTAAIVGTPEEAAWNAYISSLSSFAVSFQNSVTTVIDSYNTTITSITDM